MDAPDVRAAYLAGLIDADGHIAWRGGRNNSILIGVTNTSTDLMKWLTREVGGSISLQRVLCPPNCADNRPTHLHRKADIFRWQVTGQRALILAQAIRPHLVIKGDRADEMCRRFTAHLAIMERPKRRHHHIERETAEMAAMGWPSPHEVESD